MVSVEELVKQINEKDEKIRDLRDKIGNLSSLLTQAYLDFAILLGNEIGKSNGLKSDEVSVSIDLNGKIIVSSGINDSFKLEFDSFNKLLEHLLCMVRLQGVEDGSQVVSGLKSETQVFYQVESKFDVKKAEEVSELQSKKP